MAPLRVNLPAAPAAVRILPSSGGADNGAATTGAARANERRTLDNERAALAQARVALEQAAARIDALRQEVLDEAETHLLDLAVAIAGKVIAQEIRGERVAIEPIVREALSHAPPQRPAVVHLHPDDLATLRRDGEASAPHAALAHVQLEADPTLGRGECLVRTAEGTVMTRADDGLEQVRAALDPTEQP